MDRMSMRAWCVVVGEVAGGWGQTRYETCGVFCVTCSRRRCGLLEVLATSSRSAANRRYTSLPVLPGPAASSPTTSSRSRHSSARKLSDRATWMHEGGRSAGDPYIQVHGTYHSAMASLSSNSTPGRGRHKRMISQAQRHTAAVRCVPRSGRRSDMMHATIMHATIMHATVPLVASRDPPGR